LSAPVAVQRDGFLVCAAVPDRTAGAGVRTKSIVEISGKTGG